MSKESIPKHFDLPRTMFAATPVYKLPKPKSSEAIKEHKLAPKGAIVARAQAVGCRIGATVLDAAISDTDQRIAADLMAPALIGSSWHEMFRGKLVASSPEDTMRKVMHLPRLDELTEKEAPTSYEIWAGAIALIDEVGQTDLPVYLHMLKRVGFNPNTYTAKMARKLNASALMLGSIQVARNVERCLYGNDASLIQHEVRSAGHATFLRTQELARKIGCVPTIAQLAHPYSPLAVELMRCESATITSTYQHAVSIYSSPN